jgi:hypothetical protein
MIRINKYFVFFGYNPKWALHLYCVFGNIIILDIQTVLFNFIHLHDFNPFQDQNLQYL